MPARFRIVADAITRNSIPAFNSISQGDDESDMRREAARDGRAEKQKAHVTKKNSKEEEEEQRQAVVQREAAIQAEIEADKVPQGNKYYRRQGSI